MKKILLCALLSILSCCPLCEPGELQFARRNNHYEKIAMIRVTIIIGIVFSLISCKGKDYPQHSRASAYPQIVDSLHLNELFDNTKWTLYLLHCDDTPRNSSLDTFLFSPPKPFGSLDLRFDSLSLKKDTISFYFDFYMGDTLVNCGTFKDIRNRLFHGMRYTKGNDSLLCYLFACSDNLNYMCYSYPKGYIDTTTDRRVKPLQPEVIKYLYEHKSALDLWLYKEAKKRGVIKE